MSDILRLIAGGLIALASSYIGLLVKRRYVDRAKLYSSACAFTDRLSAELPQTKAPIPELAGRFLLDRKGNFETALSSALASMRAGKSFDEAYEQIKLPLLKTEEKKELVEFFYGLGRTTLDGQMAHIGRYGASFRDKQKKCEADGKRLGSMYFKLFVLLGIAAILILA